MKNPLVSVIIPAYNSEKFIAETIQSVQNQTYKNWEIIIVDDCSSDATTRIVNEFINNDNRIQLFIQKENSGSGIARNVALAQTKGKYIAFLDADDLWKPMKLEKQVDFLVTSNQPFTFSFYECMDESGNSIHKTVRAPQFLSYRQLFFCNYIGNLTGIYDVSYFGKIVISTLRKRQDWILWLTILKKLKTAQAVPESLAYYRVRKNSISASKINLLKHNFAVYRTFHRYSFVFSLFCMLGFLFTQLVLKPRYIKQL